MEAEKVHGPPVKAATGSSLTQTGDPSPCNLTLWAQALREGVPQAVGRLCLWWGRWQAVCLEHQTRQRSQRISRDSAGTVTPDDSHRTVCTQCLQSSKQLCHQNPRLPGLGPK